MSEESCYLCKPNRDLEHQIRKSSTRNAHKLAIQQANKGIPGLTWCEVYTVQFPKIFQHEEARQRLFLTEKDQDERLSKQNGQEVCCYHSENLGWYSDGFHQKVFRETLQKFVKGKWPNKSDW